MAENIYNPEFVKRLFNQMSDSYERMNIITSFGFSSRWRRQFLQSLKPSNEEMVILDLLTGMGETWNGLRQRFPNARISALDFSLEMLKAANTKNKRQFNDQVSIIQQDVLKNDLPSNHFDIVISAFGLKTFDNEQLETLAKETNRILKEGGRFCFIEVSKPQKKLLSIFYKFYLGQIIPILGRLFLGNPSDYKMLWRYTERFKNAREAQEIFNHSGLKSRYDSYFFGCATGISGYK